MISIFGEELSAFRSARAYFNAMEKFEQEYMPSPAGRAFPHPDYTLCDLKYRG